MAKEWTAKYDATCARCGGRIVAHVSSITWSRNKGDAKRRYFHRDCNNAPEAFGSVPDAPTPAPQEDTPEPMLCGYCNQDIHNHASHCPHAAKAAPAPAPTDTMGLGAMLADVIRPHLAAKVDRAEVESIVDDALGAYQPDSGVSEETLRTMVDEAVRTHIRIVEVSRPDAPTVRIEGAHEAFADILAEVHAGRYSPVPFSVYLYGKPGSGKSTIAHQVADALGLPFYLLTLAPMSPPSALTGYGDATGRYVESDAYKAFARGGLLMVEEIDNANDGVLTSFNAALANGHGSWPVLGTVPKHPDFVLMAAGNTPGLGPNNSFPGRRKLDAAFRDRFSFVEVPYDLALEERLTLTANADAGEWLATCRKLRDWCDTNAPQLFVTPRSCAIGASLLKLGRTTRQALASSVFRGVERDLVDRACNAVGVWA